MRAVFMVCDACIIQEPAMGDPVASARMNSSSIRMPHPSSAGLDRPGGNTSLGKRTKKTSPPKKSTMKKLSIEWTKSITGGTSFAILLGTGAR